jgi:hypothetical protein
MTYEHKPGTFSLFKNDKQGNDKRPDYKGDGVDIDGTPVRVSAWLRDGKNGKYMSCKIEPKEARQEPAKPAQDDGLDSDLPF